MPIIERLLYRNQAERATRVLILLPTRELAIQVYQVGEKLAHYTNIRMCLAAGWFRCYFSGTKDATRIYVVGNHKDGTPTTGSIEASLASTYLHPVLT